MRQEQFSSVIEKQVGIWRSRVFFPNEKFKENTPADLRALENHIFKSNEKFTIISSTTEACVYKIGRFMIDIGIKNEKITFQDSDVLEPYILTDAKYDYQFYLKCDELFEIIGKSIKNKWLVIPDMNISWNKKLAIYFTTKLQQHGCYGLLFYSSKLVSDSLAQVLCEETYSEIIQFPKEVFQYKKARKVLEEDEY